MAQEYNPPNKGAIQTLKIRWDIRTPYRSRKQGKEIDPTTGA